MNRNTGIVTAILCISFSFAHAQQWQLMTTGCQANLASCFIESPTGVMLAGTEDGIYTSLNYGSSWTLSNTGIFTGSSILCLGKNSAGIFAGSYDAIYFSTNSGTSWNLVKNTGFPVYQFTFLHDTVFAATNGGVLRSVNNGGLWSSMNNGLANNNMACIISKGQKLFAGDQSTGIFVSSNAGTSWSPVNSGLPPAVFVKSLETDGTNIYAGTRDGFSIASHGMYISSNDGGSWMQVNNGITSTDNVYHIYYADSALLAGNGDVYRSLDSGQTWNLFMNGINPTGTYGAGSFYSTASYIFCGIEVLNGGAIYRIDKSSVQSSVNSIDQKFNLIAFPNPAHEQLIVEGIGWAGKPLRIVNALGEIINEIPISEKIEINVSGYTPGLYLLQVIAEDLHVLQTEKVMVR